MMRNAIQRERENEPLRGNRGRIVGGRLDVVADWQFQCEFRPELRSH